MSRYLIVIEETPSGFSAYSPDVAGCRDGGTRAEVERNMHDALAFHPDDLREGGHLVPPPSTSAA